MRRILFLKRKKAKNCAGKASAESGASRRDAVVPSFDAPATKQALRDVGGFNNSVFVDSLYGHILNRSASPDDARSVAETLKQGLSFADILDAYFGSPEAREKQVCTDALVACYQSCSAHFDLGAQQTRAFKNMLKSFFGKQTFAGVPSNPNFPGALWVSPDGRLLQGWVLDESADVLEPLKLKTPDGQVRSLPVNWMNGVGAIRVPLPSNCPSAFVPHYDARNRTVEIEQTSKIARSLVVSDYYQRQTEKLPEDIVGDFVKHGLRDGIKPNPFFVPALYENPDSLRMALRGDFDQLKMSPLQGLIDLEYCAERNSVTLEDAIAFATTLICSDKWVEFNPLLTELDYQSSGSPNILEWLSRLTNANKSLVGLQFTRFMPDHYRLTCSEARFENELVDHIYNLGKTAGQPHVLCDLPFAAGQLPEDHAAPWRGIWADSLKSPSDYPIKLSPFWEPLHFQHCLFTEHDQLVPHDKAPLDVMLEQASRSISLSTCVLPAALLYSFEGRAIEASEPKHISGAQSVALLKTILGNSTKASDAKIKTSICILNYNNVGFTILSAIAAALNCPEDGEVLVLDNGSSDDDFGFLQRYLAKFGNVQVLRSSKNLYFGEGNNILVDAAQGENILFLNNDAFIGPQTVKQFEAYLQSEPLCGGVGPTFVFPDLEIQEAGATMSDCGRQVQLNKHSSLAQHQEFASSKPKQGVDYISAACLCVRRSALDEVGGFDWIYEPFYYEDADLCKRMSNAGHRIDQLPDAYAVHYENASTRGFLGERIGHQVDRSRMTYQKRWMYHQPGYKPRKMLEVFDTPATKAKKTAVVFTNYDIAVDSVTRYMLSGAIALSQDFNVVFCTSKPTSRTRMSFVMDDLGIPTEQAGSIRLGTLDELTDCAEAEVMIAASDELDRLPALCAKLNLLYCPDPTRLIEGLEHVPGGVHGVLTHHASQKSRLEAAFKQIGAATLVYATEAPARSLGDPDSSGAPEGTDLKLLTIGAFAAERKQQETAIEILKGVQKAEPEASLALLGTEKATFSKQPDENTSCLERLVKQGNGLNVSFHTNATREIVEQKLQAADIYLHTNGFGQRGLETPDQVQEPSIAVFEAMLAGAIPIVARAGEVAQLVEKTGCGFVFDTRDQAGQQILHIGSLSASKRKTLSQKAAKAAASYSDASFHDTLRGIVTK